MEPDRDEIAALTQEYGGEWGIYHARCLLHLVTLIDGGEDYDSEAVWLAAHLHDWGGYQQWAEPGVDHAARSAKVAADFLRSRGCPEARLALVLEAIRTHHAGGPGRSLEAMLLSDADALDLLGAIGVLRAFSMSARDLRSAYSSKAYRASRPKRLPSPISASIAAARWPVEKTTRSTPWRTRLSRM